MGETPLLRLPYPDGPEGIDPDIALRRAMEAVERRSVMVFSDETARAAGLVHPVDGMVTGLRNRRRHEVFLNGAWSTLLPSTAVVLSRAGVGQSIPHNVWTPVQWDTEDPTFTTDAVIWSAGAPSVVAIPWTGDYGVTATLGLAGNVTGRRSIAVAVTRAGVTTRTHVDAQNPPPAGADIAHLNIDTDIGLFAGDTVAIHVLQTSGVPLLTDTSETIPRLTIDLRYVV